MIIKPLRLLTLYCLKQVLNEQIQSRSFRQYCLQRLMAWVMLWLLTWASLTTASSELGKLLNFDAVNSNSIANLSNMRGSKFNFTDEFDFVLAHYFSLLSSPHSYQNPKPSVFKDRLWVGQLITKDYGKQSQWAIIYTQNRTIESGFDPQVFSPIMNITPNFSKAVPFTIPTSNWFLAFDKDQFKQMDIRAIGTEVFISLSPSSSYRVKASSALHWVLAVGSGQVQPLKDAPDYLIRTLYVE
jgi:hypothetical protein